MNIALHSDLGCLPGIKSKMVILGNTFIVQIPKKLIREEVTRVHWYQTTLICININSMQLAIIGACVQNCDE